MRSVYGPIFRISLLVIVRALCCFFLPASFAIGQTTYYVSSDGNDANVGTPASAPWRTIEKLNAAQFMPGDVILFRRGDEFFGQLTLKQSGLPALPIRVGSYGDSDRKPVITGAVRLSGWTAYKGSIFVTKAPLPVTNLFCDGVQMTIARYPNTALLSVGTTNGTTTLTAPGLTQVAGYWNGANLRLRTTDFAFETRPVASYSGTTLSLANAVSMSIRSGFGFYLDNKLEELDAPGEWYCDPTTNNIYFFAPGGSNPDASTVEGSILDYGINSTTQSNITIGDLSFRCQSRAAIQFSGIVNNIRILSNDVFGGLLDGISFEGTSIVCSIDGNTIQNINNRGITLDNINQSVISNNTVKNVGLVHGYSLGIDPLHPWLFNGASGITLRKGSGNVVRGNTLDSIGYIGIRPAGEDLLVENNLVKHTMLSFADGGAIYILGVSDVNPTSRVVVRNNIVEDVVGNNIGVPQPSWTIACGLYIDAATERVRLEGNTIVRASGIGIFLQVNTYKDTIVSNVVYDCGSAAGGAYVQIVQDISYARTGQMVIKKNILYSMKEGQKMFLIQDNKGPTNVPGILDSNYYCCSYDNNRIPFQLTTNNNGWTDQKLSLEQWKAYSGQDQHSKGLFTKLNPFIVTDSSAANLVLNGQFQSSVAGWANWDKNTQLQHVVDGVMNSGCLQFRLFGTTPNPIGVAISNQFAVSKGQWYQLSFSTRAPQGGLLKIGAVRNHLPYSTLMTLGEFPMKPERTDYSSLCSADTTDAQAVINFQVAYPDSIFILGNVSFRPVKGTYLTPEFQNPVFVNRSAEPRTIDLGVDLFRDIEGKPVSTSITLAPYSSRILIRDGLGTDKTSSVDTHSDTKPGQYFLRQNYPNPFNPSTVIRYGLPIEGRVELAVFDTIGRLVATLVDGIQKSGYHEVTFTNPGLATGVYFYRLSAGGYTQTMKMLLLK